MSFPYHIGNGVFGGLVPMVGLAWITATGNNFAGIWYPMIIAAVCFTVGMILLKETNKVDISDASTSLSGVSEAAGKKAKGE
jgi:hypothetical protein